MHFTTLYALIQCAKSYSHHKIRQMGITDTEHLICAFVYGHCNVSQDDVAAALQMDKTTVAKALASLEGKGHITRRPNPENRRKNILSITEAGKEKIAHVVHIYDDWLTQVNQALSDEEQEQFQSYCQRLLERAEQVNKGAD